MKLWVDWANKLYESEAFGGSCFLPVGQLLPDGTFSKRFKANPL